jgi:hypothetical protein
VSGRIPGSVLVAYPHPGTVIQHSFASALMSLATWDATHHGRLLAAGGPLGVRCASGQLVDARNMAMRTFLDEQRCEWLWMVDTDMGFPADALDRLVDAADPDARPVVGGLTFGLKMEDPDGMGGYHTRPFPVMYDLGVGPDGTKGFGLRWAYPDNAVFQVAATGAACLLVHHTAAEKVREKFGPVWFDHAKYPDGRIISEDLSFCWRLGVAGVPIFIHTGVKTTHAKQIWLSEQHFVDDCVLRDLRASAQSMAVPPGVQVSEPAEAGLEPAHG